MERITEWLYALDEVVFDVKLWFKEHRKDAKRIFKFVILTFFVLFIVYLYKLFVTGTSKQQK